MTDFDRELEVARGQIVRSLGAKPANERSPRPSELLQRLAPNRDREPYRAALLTLIRDGSVEAAPDWQLRLRTGAVDR